MTAITTLLGLSDADVATFRATGAFDEQWYLNEYPDVVRSGIEPARHYLWLGKRLGRYASRAEFERAKGIGLRWCIVSTPHVLFIAHCLAEGLRRHGWTVEITLDMPYQFAHDYYIVLCAQMFDRLPPGEKRIIYQLEQSASSRWFSDNYISEMENSFAVLDYSLKNIEFLDGRGISYPLVYYLPIGASSKYGISPDVEKDIDVLFYGDYKSSPRRQGLLDCAETHFKVTRVDALFGEDIKALISRSKVVLNLHYYEGAQLEMPRIQESLSLGVPVISETTADQCDYEGLNGAITYFEAGNTRAMISAIASIIDDRTVCADAVRNSVDFWERRHAFMLDRFLIGAGILPSDALESMASELVNDGSLYALSLPETINRRRVFDVETRQPGMRVFDGIRRRPGWIGCGMSYKYLCQSAMKAGVRQFTIIEDDALISEDHNEKMNIVFEYLESRFGEWDVFSGVIAHLHEKTEVIDVTTFKGVDFITINKMTSTVFNIYSENAIRLIANWNQKNEDSAGNTIDRYLENSGLKIIVTDPYIVGHREELDSTIWGFQNTQYHDMIAESAERLSVLKKNWLRSKSRTPDITSLRY